MTTLVAVRKNNKIVLGADNQLTAGDYIHSLNFRKIFNVRLNDAHCKFGITGSSLSGISLYLQFLAQGYKVLELENIQEDYLSWDTTESKLLSYLRKRGIELQVKYLEKKIPEYNGILIITDKGKIISCESDGEAQEVHEDIASYGSGTYIALSAMYSTYDLINNADDIARRGLRAAHRFTNGTSKSCNIEYFNYGVSK